MKNFIYAFEIPNSKLYVYKIITFIILSLNVFGFGYVFLKTNTTIAVLSIFLLMINAMPWGYFLFNKVHVNFKVVAFTLIISAFFWLYIGNYVMSIALIVFSILGYITTKKLIVYFLNEGIVYPSFPTKNFEWKDIVHVILKDDVLTIDLKNNKLIQLNIEKKLPTNFEENDFNSWCAKFYNK